MSYLHIPSLMWNHSAVWQVSILSQVCCIDESFPNPRVSPFDVESVIHKVLPVILNNVNSYIWSYDYLLNDTGTNVCISYPFGKAYHWPHGTTQGAATAQTSTKEPTNIHRKVFSECNVDSCYSCFKFFWCNPSV